MKKKRIKQQSVRGGVASAPEPRPIRTLKKTETSNNQFTKIHFDHFHNYFSKHNCSKFLSSFNWKKLKQAIINLQRYILITFIITLVNKIETTNNQFSKLHFDPHFSDQSTNFKTTFYYFRHHFSEKWGKIIISSKSYILFAENFRILKLQNQNSKYFVLF
jgi:hypothetical protein